jgi:hypothetical protein
MVGAVGLDDQAGVVPEEVGLVSEHRHVHGGQRQRVFAADLEQQLLEARTGRRQRQRPLSQQRPQGSGALVTRAVGEELSQPIAVEDAVLLRLVEGPAKSGRTEPCRQIPDRPRPGRHRDAEADGDVGWEEGARPVGDDAGARARRPGRYVNGEPLPAADDPQQLSRGSMAEGGTRTAGENRRQPATLG